MGVVYEAQQISLGRRVALKVLPFAAVLDSRQIARFQHEAQAAAQLDHPNIVSVFAVGVERGVHYYAMQFIDGQPLDRAIAELRRAKPRKARLATGATAHRWWGSRATTRATRMTPTTAPPQWNFAIVDWVPLLVCPAVENYHCPHCCTSQQWRHVFRRFLLLRF